MAITRNFSGMQIRKPAVWGGVNVQSTHGWVVKADWHTDMMYNTEKKADLHNSIFHLVSLMVRTEVLPGEITSHDFQGYGEEPSIMLKIDESMKVNRFIEKMVNGKSSDEN